MTTTVLDPLSATEREARHLCPWWCNRVHRLGGDARRQRHQFTWKPGRRSSSAFKVELYPLGQGRSNPIEMLLIKATGNHGTTSHWWDWLDVRDARDLGEALLELVGAIERGEVR